MPINAESAKVTLAEVLVTLFAGCSSGKCANGGIIWRLCASTSASDRARFGSPAKTWTVQGWVLELLGAVAATARISATVPLEMASGRNARTALREQITASTTRATDVGLGNSGGCSFIMAHPRDSPGSVLTFSGRGQKRVQAPARVAHTSQNSTVFKIRRPSAFFSKVILRQPFWIPRNPSFLREHSLYSNIREAVRWQIAVCDD